MIIVHEEKLTKSQVKDLWRIQCCQLKQEKHHDWTEITLMYLESGMYVVEAIDYQLHGTIHRHEYYTFTAANECFKRVKRDIRLAMKNKTFNMFGID